MVDTISDVLNIAMAMQQQKFAQQVDFAVLNKAQDLQKQQGEAVLQLLDSAKVGSSGIDVRV